MPKEVSDIKKFMKIFERDDTKGVAIKKGPKETKFKIRTSRVSNMFL